MSSRDRLLRTLLCKETDRIPISLYEFDGFYDSWIHKHPEYVRILRYAEDKTDKMYFWAPIKKPPVLFYGIVDEETLKHTTWKENNSTYTKTEISSPKGILHSISKQNDNIHTSWTIKYLCESVGDAKKILSLPFNPWEPHVDSFFELDKRLGDTGIPMGDIADALCLTVGIFGMTKFLKLYIKQKDLIFELLDFFQERISSYLTYLLKQGAVTIYRIYGPEYATPPYLNPIEFDNLVTAYDVELVELLHKYGGYARLHSHGKVKKVLKSFKQMKIDATDPLEPPPDGDVELNEARRILGNEIVLIGNIEERIFETGDKRIIEKQVRKAIEQGAANGGFILCPTAMPITTPLALKIQENIIHYIDYGLKYSRRPNL